jgi:hypothetical protein
VQDFAAEHRLPNVKCLPYQPLDQLAASLSGADVHVVVMGIGFTGIVHPSKIYNVLRIGAPVLAIGPEESHVVDVLQTTGVNGQAFSVRHGEVDQIVNYLLAQANEPLQNRPEPRAGSIDWFSRATLMPQMINVLVSSARQRV